MNRPFFDFRTEHENLHFKIWQLKEYNAIFRITEDTNYNIIERRKKDGWIIINQEDLIETKYNIKVLLWSLAKDIREYNYLLDLPILEVWELILIDKMANYEGEPPNADNGKY